MVFFLFRGKMLMGKKIFDIILESVILITY